MDAANARVDGEVTLKLYKGSASVVARSSPHALYDRSLASFGESGGEFSEAASPGFIELFTLQSRLAHRVRERATRVEAEEEE
jgi:argininosuccinate synthase